MKKKECTHDLRPMFWWNDPNSRKKVKKHFPYKKRRSPKTFQAVFELWQCVLCGAFLWKTEDYDYLNYKIGFTGRIVESDRKYASGYSAQGSEKP